MTGLLQYDSRTGQGRHLWRRGSDSRLSRALGPESPPHRDVPASGLARDPHPGRPPRRVGHPGQGGRVFGRLGETGEDQPLTAQIAADTKGRQQVAMGRAQAREQHGGPSALHTSAATAPYSTALRARTEWWRWPASRPARRLARLPRHPGRRLRLNWWPPPSLGIPLTVLLAIRQCRSGGVVEGEDMLESAQPKDLGHLRLETD